MSTTEDQQPTFEDLSAQLDEVLVLLERGDLPLEDALSAYERGVQLVRKCNDLLDHAELRITQLSASVTKGVLTANPSPGVLFDLEDEDE